MNSTASGYNSFVAGFNTTASGDSSAAIGYNSIASGGRSFALGDSNQSIGESSTALGQLSTSQGAFSLAANIETTAVGIGSTALGKGTIAGEYASLAIGHYNVQTSYGVTQHDILNVAFAIGNGTDDTNRSNAFSVKFDGTTTVAGDIQMEGNQINNVADPTDPQDVATKNYVDSVGPTVAKFAWESNYFNITPNVENFIPWNTEKFNSSQNNEISLVSSGSTTNAAIKVSSAGYYEVKTSTRFYDLTSGRYLDIKIAKKSNDNSWANTDVVEVLFSHVYQTADNKDKVSSGSTILYLDANDMITIGVVSNHGLYPANLGGTQDPKGALITIKKL